MKRQILGFIIGVLATSSISFSQISEGGIPFAILHKLSIDNIQSKSVTADKAQIDNLLKMAKEKLGPFYTGVKVDVNINSNTSGTWEVHQDYWVWRVKIKSEGSKALSVLFDDFYLPPGSRLFLYNTDRSQTIGAFTSFNNHESRKFATELIAGDEVILEYSAKTSIIEKPSIHINQVVHTFRGVDFLTQKANLRFGGSDPCQVNINCSEGVNWQNQKRSVVRMLVTDQFGQGWCTGALINNLAQDCKPYVLTADHCGGNASANFLNQWIFYFNYESNSCANGTANQVPNNTMTGCVRRANSGGEGFNDSDLLLVELNNQVPQNYNPFFSGWDRRNQTSASGVSIHHPAGDIKKISTYNTNLISDNWEGNVSGTHWRVRWVATANGHGVTESGSSGSPLYNAAGRIVGKLTGGTSFCSAPNDPDWYGKISYSWESTGTTANRRLKEWLDPNNTGLEFMDGINSPCGVAQGAVCNTTSNFNIQTHTPTIYAIQAPENGYVSGHNSYLDKAKADKFTGPFAANTTLEEVNLFFGRKFTNTNGQVTARIWNANGAGGSPGTVLASQNFNINSIPVDGNPVVWDLSSNPIAITGDFFVGITLNYWAQDTVVLLTNLNGETNPGTAWEQWSDNSWHTYSSAWNLNVSHAITVKLCTPQTGAPPVADFTANQTTINAGQTVIFNDLSTNSPTSWSWNISPAGFTYVNGTNSSSQNPQVRFDNLGTYNVSLTASNNFGSSTETKNQFIKVNTTGLAELNGEEVSIFPNPSSGIIFINTNDVDVLNITLSELSGKQIPSTGNIQQTSNGFSLDLSDLKSGVYLLKLNTNKGSTVEKLILSTFN